MCRESAVGSNPAYMVCGEDSKMDFILGLEGFIRTLARFEVKTYPALSGKISWKNSRSLSSSTFFVPAFLE